MMIVPLIESEINVSMTERDVFMPLSLWIEKRGEDDDFIIKLRISNDFLSVDELNEKIGCF